MSNTKFTEGEWELELESDLVNMALIIDGNCVMCDDPHDPWVPENKYDWCLMAQSKNMYNMIDELCHSMTSMIRTENSRIEAGIKNTDTEEPERLDWQQIHEAQALLTKARGEK